MPAPAQPNDPRDEHYFDSVRRKDLPSVDSDYFRDDDAKKRAIAAARAAIAEANNLRTGIINTVAIINAQRARQRAKATLNEKNIKHAQTLTEAAEERVSRIRKILERERAIVTAASKAVVVKENDTNEYLIPHDELEKIAGWDTFLKRIKEAEELQKACALEDVQAAIFWTEQARRKEEQHQNPERTADVKKAESIAKKAISAARQAGVEGIDEIAADFETSTQAANAARKARNDEQQQMRAEKLESDTFYDKHKVNRAVSLVLHLNKKYRDNESLQSSRMLLDKLKKDQIQLEQAIAIIHHHLQAAEKKDDNLNRYLQDAHATAMTLAAKLKQGCKQTAVATHAETTRAVTLPSTDTDTFIEEQLKGLVQQTLDDTVATSASLVSGAGKPKSVGLRGNNQAIIRVQHTDLKAGGVGYRASVTKNDSKQGVVKTSLYLDGNTLEEYAARKKKLSRFFPNHLPDQDILEAAEDFVHAHLDDNHRKPIDRNNKLRLNLTGLPDNLARAIVIVCIHQFGDKHVLDIKHGNKSIKNAAISSSTIKAYQQNLEKRSRAENKPTLSPAAEAKLGSDVTKEYRQLASSR